MTGFRVFLAISVVLLFIGGCSGDDHRIADPSVSNFTSENLSAVSQVRPATLQVFDYCGVVNGDFFQGFVGWTDESEGPGLPSGIMEIVNVDGRLDVLHADSRAGGNYYLFLTQTIPTCGVLNSELSWDWRLAQIERNYGLAAVWLEFKDGMGDVIGRYFVRRHTGDFPAYECSSIMDEICGISHPEDAVGCEQLTGTSFDWETKSLHFTQEFFDNLECSVLDPAKVDSIKIWIQSYNNAGSGVDAYFDNFVYVSQGAMTVALDIRPGSCPNPINPKSKGVLPVAILGAADFDVLDVDVSSLLLEGIVPVRSSIEDVSTPVVGGERCDCTDLDPDGFDDLALKFAMQDIVGALGLLDAGDVIVLTITGTLLDGTVFESSDCVVIVGNGEKEPKFVLR